MSEKAVGVGIVGKPTGIERKATRVVRHNTGSNVSTSLVLTFKSFYTSPTSFDNTYAPR